jgi:hypothetical protein
VKYDTAWLLHNKILRAMADREEAYLLRGKIQIDDSYLGGELPGGSAGRGSEYKIPIVAAISLNESGHPIHARMTAVSGFSSEAIADWAKHHLASGSQVLSDGLACFRSVTTAGCSHEAIVTGGKHPSELPHFRWINTLLGNLKNSFNGTFHAFNFDKYARHYLGGYCFRFDRRFSMVAMTERTHRECGLLLHALHRTESQGCGGLWVIKICIIHLVNRLSVDGHLLASFPARIIACLYICSQQRRVLTQASIIVLIYALACFLLIN